MNIPLLIVILYVLLLFGISIYVSYSQKKDSENFLLYKEKNNAFVVAASIAGLAIGAVVSSMLAVCGAVFILISLVDSEKVKQ